MCKREKRKYTYIYKYQINQILFNVNNNNTMIIMHKLPGAWVNLYFGTQSFVSFANQKIVLLNTGWKPLP